VKIDKRGEKHPHEHLLVDEVRKMRDEGGFSGFWQSLSACPARTTFEVQDNKEVVLLLMRKHVVTNIGWIFLALVLFLIPFVWSEFPLINMISSDVSFGLTVLWYMGVSLFIFQKILFWFYNVYIVTDERIVDIDFFGLLHKNVNVTYIKNVQDVHYSQIGIMSSLFNFGNVVVQTSAEQRSDDRFAEQSAFTFEAVFNPDRVTRAIVQLMEQEEKEAYEGRTR